VPSARRPVPKFHSETEERAFWDSHDTVDYVDWARAVVAGFPNLKPSSFTISLRLPAPLLFELKRLANKRDVPYQSLLKIPLAEQAAAESAKALPNKRVRRAVARSPSRKTTRLAGKAHRR
jgi:predicted DNA binding CopG/RHH family protein